MSVSRTRRTGAFGRRAGHGENASGNRPGHRRLPSAEARPLHHRSLTRMLARWANVELIVIDELGYVPLAEVAAELLFQVIADRAEKAAVIVTTNLPFSKCRRSLPMRGYAGRFLTRLTDQAHIIETGAESYRFAERWQEAKNLIPQGVAVRFCFRFTLRTPLQQNEHYPLQHKVGHIKRPEQLGKRNCGPEGDLRFLVT